MKSFFIIFFMAVLLATPIDLKSGLGIEMYLCYQEKVFGGYRECLEYSYMYKSGGLDINSKKINRKILYDEKGNILREIVFKNDSSMVQIFSKKYDEKGNIVEVVQIDNDTIIIKYKYKFDEKGNKIEQLMCDKNDSIGLIFTYQYDNHGNIIEEFDYYTSGDILIQKKITNKYDDIGYKIEELEFEDERQTRHAFRYNDKGFLIEDKLFNEKNILVRQEIFEYSDTVRIHKEIKWLNADNSYKYKLVYKYDENGNIYDSIDYEPDGAISSRCTYKYDNFGNQVEKVIYHGKEPIKKYVYIFSK